MADEHNIEITIPKAPLKRGETHPGAAVALDFCKKFLTPELTFKYLTVFRENEDFSSCTYALEHLLNGKMVSDKYIMGLALTIQELEMLQSGVS